LAELRRDHGEGHALAQALNDIGREAAHLSLLARILNWDEDLSNQEFGLANTGALGSQELIHFGIRYICLFAKHGAQQPGPTDLRADLVIQNARLYPGAAQILHHATWREAIAAFDIGN
jgi:hypothetical protein